MKTRVLTAIALAGCLVQAAGCGSAHADYRELKPGGEALHTAVQQLTDVIVYDIFSPPQASRAYAYASVAAYETLRHGDSTYRTLAGQLNGLGAVPAPDSASHVYLPLAGIHSFLTVGRALTFSRARMDSVRDATRARYAEIGVPKEVIDSSVAYGERVAQHVLAWAAKDNFLQTRGYPKYTVTSERGRWVPTPPAYADALEPNWAKHRSFTLDSSSQFRPAPPHAFDTKPTSAFFREAREVYDISRQLTEDQRALVLFWDDNPLVMHVRGHAMFATKKATPGGHWMAIAGNAAKMTNLGLIESAVVYMSTAVALADGFISCWDEKFRSNVIRPETYINSFIDEAWTPMLQTPPFPEYTSGHSVISNAAAEVLTAYFGDAFAFTDSSEVPYGLTVRSFKSFREAAAEAAESRIFGGIHYRRAAVEGATQGRKVGEYVAHKTRVRDQPLVAQRSSASSNVH